MQDNYEDDEVAYDADWHMFTHKFQQTAYRQLSDKTIVHCSDVEPLLRIG